MYNKFISKEVRLMSDENNDIIKMNTDINLTDCNGNPIQIETPRPEYITETFDFHSNNQKIFTGDNN